MTNAKTEAYWGLFIADALAMPAHWFYDQHEIKSRYGGWLTKYMAPDKKHPGSFMFRMPDRSEGTIGTTILHGTYKLWNNQDPSTHYHHGMEAGDSTLNSIVALETAKMLLTADGDKTMAPVLLQCAVLQHYVQFMTTEGAHNDIYAENFHRYFFRNWRKQAEPPTVGTDIYSWCIKRWKSHEAGEKDDTLVDIKPQVGIIPLAVPWVLHYAEKPEDECIKNTLDAMKLFYPIPPMYPYLDLYCRLLYRVVNGKSLKEEVMNAINSDVMARRKKSILNLAQQIRKFPAGSEDRLEAFQESVNTLGPACYIEGATSCYLLLALMFDDEFEGGVLMNANCGGENCHRGASLGALLGAEAGRTGKAIPQHLKDGLHSSKSGIQKVLPLFQ